MKRMVLLPALVLAGCDSGSTGPPPPEPLTRVEYLQQHAAPLTGLDLDDDDFSDLEPLKAMIGDAHIVSLGEATHGDGATLEAKARLVKFLHREMGFDVLAWESGFWDVQKAWSYVEAGEPVVPSLQRGIFSAWSHSVQVARLFDYLVEAAGTGNPIELVGFDMQFSAAPDTERAAADLPGDLRDLLERHGSAAAADARFGDFASAIPNMLGEGWLFEKPPDAEKDRFLASVDFLRAELARLGAASGAGELEYAVQLLESVRENARARWAWSQTGGLTYTNMRDRQMARNLVWYADRAYPDRKVIVWGATSHVMRDRAALQGMPADAWMSMGDNLKPVFGDAMYVIGFTSYDGVWGNVGQPTKVLEPAPPASIEALFVEAGFDLAVVDLRAPAPDGEWLRESFSSRPVGHFPIDFRWSRSLDALVFIRTMTPNVKLGN